MLENLQLTGGTIYSQGVLLALARRGVSREQAYRWVQKNAMDSFEKGTSFKENLLNDAEVMKVLSADEVESLFNVEHHLRQIPAVFRRVFGK